MAAHGSRDVRNNVIRTLLALYILGVFALSIYLYFNVPQVHDYFIQEWNVLGVGSLALLVGAAALPLLLPFAYLERKIIRRSHLFVRNLRQTYGFAAPAEKQGLGTMNHPPMAFMSYAHFDDQNDDNYLSEFRQHLSNEVRMQTGDDFKIFQDRDGIGWGENWKQKLDLSLSSVTFLIPIITPNFFKSQACRKEVERFIQRERELGRDDLILPVYYIDTPLLNNKTLSDDDPIAKAIADHQYADWRSLRRKSFKTEKVRDALTDLAREVAMALQRTVG